MGRLPFRKVGLKLAPANSSSLGANSGVTQPARVPKSEQDKFTALSAMLAVVSSPCPWQDPFLTSLPDTVSRQESQLACSAGNNM
jgi:hypothetical protein